MCVHVEAKVEAWYSPQNCDYFLRQGLLLTRKLTNSASLASQKSQHVAHVRVTAQSF